MTDMDNTTIQNLYAARHVNSVPPERRRIPYRNIGHVLSMHTCFATDKTFLIHLDKDGNRESFSYAVFNARIHQAAAVLYHELGVRPGDRVATIAYNHSDTVIIYFACWLIGAAVAPQNIAEDDRRIAFILRNSEAVICLVRNEYLERAERIIHGDGDDDELGAANIRAIVTVGDAPVGEYLHFNALMQQRSPTLDSNLAEVVSLDAEALLVYTSGTTGAPKGVVLTQYNLLVDAFAIANAQGITGNERMMCVLPIHHVNGIVVTLITPFLIGASVVLSRTFSASRFWRTVIDENVNIVSVVPTLLQFLLEHGQKQEADGNGIFGEEISRGDIAHFRHFICGAGTLALILARDFEDAFSLTILHGYGLSETTCYSCFLPIDISWDEHLGWMRDHGYPSIGVPIQANEMAIFSADGSGQRLGPGERGEICIRGHNVMKHYFKRPDANAETFRFRWFRSGDEGFFLEDSSGRPFFFITGRIKELINRGGVKFSPFDIEEVLLDIPGVNVGLAVAFENSYYGEEVGAYVVLEEGVSLGEAQIIAYCRERMTFEKSPKAVVFGNEIPVTSTGKYQRLKLKGLFTQWQNTQFRK